ncbi:MAG TPA: hypothetical protein VGQ57_00400 [Polyangiaceae bacterium]|nr:hypothetical protein [Polyangiaceae bacterium]
MSLRHFPGLAAVATLALTGTLACGGSHEPATSAGGSLPPYTPEAAVLFDDLIAPAVFGFDPEGRTPARDPHIRERTRVADFVVPARVETVSRVGGVEHKGSYEITLKPNGPPLVGDPGNTPLILNIPATNSSYIWVEGAGAQWVGAPLLLFGRHYQDGAAVALHFRGEPDTPEFRKEVERDAGLRLLR